MIELALLALLAAASIVLRIAMSRPPRHGLAKAVIGRPDSPALPVRSPVIAADAFSGLPTLPVAPYLSRMPDLPLPDTSLAVLGIEVSMDDNDKQLWLAARDRLSSRP